MVASSSNSFAGKKHEKPAGRSGRSRVCVQIYLKKILNLPIDIFRGVARDLIGIGLTFFAATGVAAGICLHYDLPLVFSWFGGVIAVGLLVAHYYYE